MRVIVYRLAGALSIALAVLAGISHLGPVSTPQGRTVVTLVGGTVCLARTWDPGLELHSAEIPSPVWPRYTTPPATFSNSVVLSIPLWPLVGITLAICLVLARMRAKLHDPGHCVSCGYDLTGNVSGRCPECGALTNELHESQS
jgi:hypothetical protein